MADEKKISPQTSPVPPGVCLSWEENIKEYGLPVGDKTLIKNQWEQLDAFAYLYLWWWVQR